MIEVKNTVGRPREHNRIQIGKDFVEWAKTHPDCLTVPHFTTQNGLTTSRLLAWYDEDAEFREYYIEAKEQIGINRLNATRLTEENETNQGKKALDKTIYLRHVNNFDPDKRKFDREEKAYEADLKKGILNDNVDILVKTISYANHLKEKSIVKEDTRTNTTT